LPLAHGEGRKRPEVERESTPGVWLIFFMTPTLSAFDGERLGEGDVKKPGDRWR
jgi:hypothetical protein